MNLPGLILRTVERQPDRVALRQGEQTFTYGRMWMESGALARGLRELGLKKGEKAFLLCDNRPEWLICDLGILRAGGVDVPRGSVSPARELRELLLHSDSTMLIVERPELLERFGRLPPLRAVILIEGEAPGATRLRDILQGAPSEMGDLGPSQEGDLATILYTSGTTGRPKGVMLTHGNLVANARQALRTLPIYPEDLLLAILPLWHAFERMVEYTGLAAGAGVFYTDLRRLAEDLKRVRPTVLAAVPRIWEAVRRKAKVPKTLLEAAFRWRQRRHILSLPLFLIGELLAFRRLRKALGGRLRLAISGGGSLPREVDRFFKACGITLLNGYGLTEASPIVSVRTPERNPLGTVGRPLPGTEVRVEGTIRIRGPQVMKGYYKDPEATAQVLEDGWLDTGDLGAITPEGDLIITGRAKDTIVLLSGENVEPEPIEERLRESPLIEDAIVLGQDRKHLVALFLPSGELKGMGCEEVRGLIHREVERLVNRDPCFRPEERIVRFALLERPLSEEHLEGEPLLTPTLKKRRHLIELRFRDLIESLYRA
ncbi:MAG TPA: long-chain fatty acid--CoA ligase [Deltaproteobacteria bacterium]|nr:long-chain fatty acid--CoA ligase [Deltaproteobacteria bacterium]